MKSKEHWEKVYTAKTDTDVSWYQAHAQLSLKLIRDANIPTSAAIIDVGGGASTLVDDLLINGYEHVTVLDLSGAAMLTVKTRIGVRAAGVRWLEADILAVELASHAYDVWHDRAVFHFLTTKDERHAYVQKVLHAVKPGGLVIIATFAENGPTTCSGLPVMRYSANDLHSEFGQSFEFLGHVNESHYTPNGNEQMFVYCFFRTVAA